MRRSISIVLVTFLVSVSILSARVDIEPAGASSTIIKVDPALTEYAENAVGEEFTIAVKIADVTNLYGFDIRLGWNTSFLEHVSHSAHVPKNAYADGVLWEPFLEVKNEVNLTDGTYWVAFSSLHPAPSFNGSGTAFTITFRVIYHPVEPEPTANIQLDLYSTDLVDKGANKITHTPQHGTVVLYAIAMHTRMYIDPKKRISNVSDVYHSKPSTTTTAGVAQPYYFHSETTTIGAEEYYLLVPTGADSEGVNLVASMGTPGRTLWGKTVFPLEGVASISAAAAWTFYYRTWFDASPSGGTAYAIVDILVRRNDGTIRSTIATSVAKSTALSSTMTTRSGTYSFASLAVTDQTDYLEIDYFLNVTATASKNAYLRIEDTSLATTAQTRIANPTMIPYAANPTNAYDGDHATYADFLTNADGTVDFKTFNTTFPGTNIAQVDLKIKYQAFRVAGGDDRFRIIQAVSPSTAQEILLDWTTSDSEVLLDTYTWSNITEPNDGIWSWDDLSNIVIRFETDVVANGDDREVRVYEIWATIYDKPFTVNLRAELVEDLYAWNATIAWNPTIIGIAGVSEGAFLTGPEGTVFTYTIDPGTGYANLSQQIVGGYQGVTGAGILAKLTFKALREGKSSIALSETHFLNSALEPFDHAAESGSFSTPSYHDIAVTDVIPSKNEVYQEEVLLFNVVVRNKGTYTESFTVFSYANSTLLESKAVTDLVGEAETILSFSWNTADYLRGDYALNATTTVEGDYDTGNNMFTYRSIRVKLLGDTDDDGQVDAKDLYQLGKAFGSTGGPPADPNWNIDADLNGDNTVNSLDLSALNRKYGKTS
nr:dockerin type I domain-containing protein [Candidatus Njordarchaeum guaymaensis]